MSKNFDTDYMDDVVCPWCGAEHEVCEDWGWNACSEVETQCVECGQPFKATVHYSVSYSTEKPKAGEEGA